MKASDYNGESMINIISEFRRNYLKSYREVDWNKPILLLPHNIMISFLREAQGYLSTASVADYKSNEIVFMGFRLIESDVDEIEIVVRAKDESE